MNNNQPNPNQENLNTEIQTISQTNNNQIDTKNNQQRKIQTSSKKNKTVFGGNNKQKPTKLIRFKYKVKDIDGKMIESFFDAETQMDVQSFLLNKGYEIISITEDKFSTSLGLTSLSSTKK